MRHWRCIIDLGEEEGKGIVKVALELVILVYLLAIMLNHDYKGDVLHLIM
jgi:hypothetical protein